MQPVSKLGQNFARHITTCVPGFFQMFPHFSYASTAQLYQQLITLINKGTINIPAHIRRPTKHQAVGTKRPNTVPAYEPPQKKIKFANPPNIAPVRRVNGDPRITKPMFFAKLREAKLNRPDRKLEKAQFSLEKYKQITELLGACFDPSNYPQESEAPSLLVEKELLEEVARFEKELEELKAAESTVEDSKKERETYLRLFSNPAKFMKEAQDYTKDTSLTWFKSLKKCQPCQDFDKFDNLIEIA